MLADDLLVLIRLWHFGEEVFDEIVGSHGGQVPLELVHQKQFHLLQRMRNTVKRRQADSRRSREWGQPRTLYR